MRRVQLNMGGASAGVVKEELRMRVGDGGFTRAAGRSCARGVAAPLLGPKQERLAMSESVASGAVDAVVEAARGFLGERITTSTGHRDHQSHGQDTHPPVMPDAVAFVESTEEVSRLLAL